MLKSCLSYKKLKQNSITQCALHGKKLFRVSTRFKPIKINSTITNYKFLLGNGALCFERFNLAVKLLIRHDVRAAVFTPGTN